MVQVIATAERRAALAAALRQQGRARPAVVISIAGGETAPYVDPDLVEGELQGACDVHLLQTTDASWSFARGLPDGRQVYGGASRVYSASLDWLEDQWASRLFFAYGSAQGERVADELVSEAFAVVHRDEQLRPRTARPASLVKSSAVVQGCIGNRALVDASGSRSPMHAAIRPELIAPGVPAERMFVKGQQLEGMLDAETNRFDPTPSRLSKVDAFADVKADAVLLAQVAKIGTTYVTVTLLPGFELRLPMTEFDPDSTGKPLVTVGEVVTVYVDQVADGVPSVVSLWEADFAEIATSVSIFPGGPQWLVPEQLVPVAVPEEGGVEDAEAEGTHGDDLEAPTALDPSDPRAPLLSENRDLTRRLTKARSQVARLDAEVAELRTSVRTARHKVKALEKEKRDLQRGGVGMTYFKDPEEQLRWDIRRVWVERTTPDDKDRFPLGDYVIGPDFLHTLQNTDGIDPAKVVEVVADVVSRRIEQMPARAAHPLREGDGAEDPEVTRHDGARCWRIYVEQKVSQARRLHYWRLPDGRVELSSVRLHDDFSP
jgi:hypothetical protein